MLGVVTLRDGESLSEVESLEQEKDAVRGQMRKMEKDVRDYEASVEYGMLRGKSEAISDQVWASLDLKGGMIVFDEIKRLGYSGEKPVMFLTTQEAGGHLCPAMKRSSIRTNAQDKTYVLGILAKVRL